MGHGRPTRPGPVPCVHTRRLPSQLKAVQRPIRPSGRVFVHGTRAPTEPPNPDLVGAVRAASGLLRPIAGRIGRAPLLRAGRWVLRHAVDTRTMPVTSGDDAPRAPVDHPNILWKWEWPAAKMALRVFDIRRTVQKSGCRSVRLPSFPFACRFLSRSPHRGHRRRGLKPRLRHHSLP